MHTYLFNDDIFQIFRDYLTFAGIGLTNAQVFEMSVGEFKQNKVSLFPLVQLPVLSVDFSGLNVTHYTQQRWKC